jgi:hypothetical protein
VKYSDTEIDALIEVYRKLPVVCNYGRVNFIAEFSFTLFCFLQLINNMRLDRTTLGFWVCFNVCTPDQSSLIYKPMKMLQRPVT